MDTSPRLLTSPLQKYPFPLNGWKPRTNDQVIQEIIRDRRAAIESGRLKGRRLFSALEGGGELVSQRNERCNACSTVMIHESEVMSLCYYYSSSRDDDDDEDEVENGSCACVENEEIDKVLVGLEEKGGIGVSSVDGSWWMVRIAWMAVGFVVFAFVIISAKSFAGREDGERLIPT